MSDLEHVAEEKFWRTPELIESLLTFLDLDSILRLAESHELTRNILQGLHNRSKLIQRSCPQNDANDNPELQKKHVDTVKHLAAALMKLMDGSEAFLLDLLDLICHRFAAVDDTPLGQDWLHLSCPRHLDGHLVSSHGFVLLEIVEGTFGTTKQSIEDFKVRALEEPMLSVLSSRLSRQEVMPTGTSSVEAVHIRSTEDARCLRTLKQCFPEWETPYMCVEGDIGRAGWEALDALEAYESYVLPGPPQLPYGWSCDNVCCQQYDSEDFEDGEDKGGEEEEATEEGDAEEGGEKRDENGNGEKEDEK